ncbi:MAG: hypothetical protein IT365_21710 [Candidatus Hydrogenedentes bacterium]|nr:hypothetical protein [Candidatus Hydrogenedentota bacterium]
MRVEPPTDAAARGEAAGQEDGRLPVVCFCERACYSETSFVSSTGFQTRDRESHEAYEFHYGTIAGYPALLFVLEPSKDAIGAAVVRLRQSVPWGAAVFALAGAALPLNPGLSEGQLVLITDHINLLGDHLLAGGVAAASGFGFPDMSQAYDGRLLDSVGAEAAALGQPAARGVYLACPEAMDVSAPFVRAAVDAGASVRGIGIAPFAVLGAALHVPVVAAVLLHGNARHREMEDRLQEARKSVLARVLVRAALGFRARSWSTAGTWPTAVPARSQTGGLTRIRMRAALRVS